MQDEVLKSKLIALVEVHGLHKVYSTLKGFPGYCENCGTPLDEDEYPHQPGGLGMCYTSVQRRKPRRNDGEKKDVPG